MTAALSDRDLMRLRSGTGGQAMTKETIYREDAIKAVRSTVAQYVPFLNGINMTLPLECETALRSVPSTDRPRAEWKHLKGDEWLCSNCGYVVWTEGSWEHPLERGKDYCEHCGAKMKGGDPE